MGNISRGEFVIHQMVLSVPMLLSKKEAHIVDGNISNDGASGKQMDKEHTHCVNYSRRFVQTLHTFFGIGFFFSR